MRSIGKRKTNEEFLQQLNTINPNITILGEYTRAKDRIPCKCNICNFQWNPIADSLLRGYGCPKCVGRHKTTEEFQAELMIINENIDVIGKYTNSQTKIKCKCKICGHIWKATSNNLLHGTGCPKCANNITKTHDQFIEELKIIRPDITCLGKYINAKTKIKFKCRTCGYIWNSLPTKILLAKQCPKCYGKYKTTEDFKKEMFRVNPDIEILGDYITAKTQILCKCKLCDYIWTAFPDNLLQHRGCPNCNKSNGEQCIERFLKHQNILFVPQKTFNNLRGIRNGLLPYDFYLPEYNLLIEFQGEQHIRPIKYFGGEEKFKIQQEHDKRKREYAQLHNINLLEIWYYDINNIESILLEKINEITKNNLKLESVETTGVT